MGLGKGKSCQARDCVRPRGAVCEPLLLLQEWAWLLGLRREPQGPQGCLCLIHLCPQHSYGTGMQPPSHPGVREHRTELVSGSASM